MGRIRDHVNARQQTARPCLAIPEEFDNADDESTASRLEREAGSDISGNRHEPISARAERLCPKRSAATTPLARSICQSRPPPSRRPTSQRCVSAAGRATRAHQRRRADPAQVKGSVSRCRVRRPRPAPSAAPKQDVRRTAVLTPAHAGVISQKLMVIGVRRAAGLRPKSRSSILLI